LKLDMLRDHFRETFEGGATDYLASIARQPIRKQEVWEIMNDDEEDFDDAEAVTDEESDEEDEAAQGGRSKLSTRSWALRVRHSNTHLLSTSNDSCIDLTPASSVDI
jgi:hypothetical protein